MFSKTIIIIWVCIILAVSMVGVGAWAIQQSLRVASLTADLASSFSELASTKAAHKTELARQKAKLKAKARLRRAIVAVPIVGAGLILYFEEQDFQEWLNENPDGDRAKYACEVAAHSAEILDDVVADTVEAAQSLPKSVRPNSETVKSWLAVPRCL